MNDIKVRLSDDSFFHGLFSQCKGRNQPTRIIFREMNHLKDNIWRDVDDGDCIRIENQIISNSFHRVV